MTGYRESATAEGVWMASYYLGKTMSARDAATFLINACTDDMPISAAIRNINGWAAKIVFFRDPSAKHGTPEPEACEQFAHQLATSQGWGPAPAYLARLIVILGLREGYELDAMVWAPPQIEDCVQFPVDLVSARRVDEVLYTHTEPGVLICSLPDGLPAITVTAAQMRQDRFIVTDRTNNRTYALAKEN